MYLARSKHRIVALARQSVQRLRQFNESRVATTASCYPWPSKAAIQHFIETVNDEATKRATQRASGSTHGTKGSPQATRYEPASFWRLEPFTFALARTYWGTTESSWQRRFRGRSRRPTAQTFRSPRFVWRSHLADDIRQSSVLVSDRPSPLFSPHAGTYSLRQHPND